MAHREDPRLSFRPAMAVRTITRVGGCVRGFLRLGGFAGAASAIFFTSGIFFFLLFSFSLRCTSICGQRGCFYAVSADVKGNRRIPAAAAVGSSRRRANLCLPSFTKFLLTLPLFVVSKQKLQCAVYRMCSEKSWGNIWRNSNKHPQTTLSNVKKRKSFENSAFTSKYFKK